MEQGNLVYGLVGGLTIALLVAAFTDLTRRRIYNWLNLGIALCAPLFWWASGLDLSGIAMQLVLAVSVFALLSLFFALGLMGGGDVKLLSALALWLPWQPFLKLIVMMALVGGLVTILFAIWHLMNRRKDRLQVPYGIAIAAAGLWVISTTYAPPHLLIGSLSG